jgi:hypothetical protein
VLYIPFVDYCILCIVSALGICFKLRLVYPTPLWDGQLSFWGSVGQPEVGFLDRFAEHFFNQVKDVQQMLI